ncbi:DEAD/DEAH box helicase [Bifidobacterium eulemuris]|uniref:DEAD/DEAH box helicase n=1 Tax=Bifidobacterium eulemuris TaxID=1765219 RepID=A0A261G7X3_9BIFI|nr:DEAD/DEAH box helicase [Bifidobacterium eulemuris]OZG67520.1 DEAD/DEAH box helicase [Bifidobacterium eulemuris]
MYDCMDAFAEPTRAWFAHAFGEPTEAQRRAWPAIRSGRDTLVIAPTGSGKTLAAFLSSIDRLMSHTIGEPSARGRQEDVEASPVRKRRSGRKTNRGVSVLYISPLKALAADVAKNLMRPLDGIAAECEAMGLPAPEVTVAMRSGDATPQERRRIVSHPPDILVTTPESLYLMLTSKARDVLATVDTVIVDEVHAVAGTKRGAHLALSLERLDELVSRSQRGCGAESGRSDRADETEPQGSRRVQRIGLSATVKPPEEVARFLAGSQPVEIIDPGSAPDMDLKIVEPLADMRDLQSANVKHRAGGVDARPAGEPAISGVTPAMRRLAKRKGLAKADGDGIGYQAIVGAAGDGMGGMGSPTGDQAGSIWPVIERSVLEEILAHKTTLVFVNSRGLAEKLTARLNDLYADTIAPSRHSERSAAQPRNPDTGSPEGRSSFARHYDAVVGGTTQLVHSHETSDVIAMAHHGSVSKDRRKRIEDDLKNGRLRCVVATSSLELGIDMGSVDLVIQIAPPLSVSSGLQRVGRADHRVGGVSHALFYPLTREQIIGSAASIEAMRAGDIEPIHMPRNPLDILAQHTVAAASMDDLDADHWFEIVRRAAPFAGLERGVFDSVMGMMTGAYNSEDFSAFRPPLMFNEDAGLISARPGAQRLAVTSGGTIPDRGLYTVVLPEADAGKGPRRVGELDEEMVYESRVGDVITLGTSTWQIQEITRDRVTVLPAPGRTARLPFWHGDGNGRDAAFGRTKGRFLRETSAALIPSHPDHDPASSRPPEEMLRLRCAPLSMTNKHHQRPSEQSTTSACPPEWTAASSCHPERSAAESKDPSPRFSESTEQRLIADGLDRNSIDNLAALLAEQRACTGVVPNDRHLVIERCPSEEGDWQVILHSPYGRRVHEPWAMAVSHRIKQRYGFDGQTYAADDGIILRLPDGVAVGESLSYGETSADTAAADVSYTGQDRPLSDGMSSSWLRDMFLFDTDELTRDVETQVGESVLFAARFRECAARSLFLPRTDPGKRVPLWQQRLRAAQLLNAARTRRNFPLLLETARECLQDVYDMAALRELMTGLNAGTIALGEAETQRPSPFAENLLFGYVGQVMYQYDVPQAERSAQLLSIDPEVLERLLGSSDMTSVLDEQVITQVEAELAARTFWNDLDLSDVVGRVTRFAKTHGPFTSDEVMRELALDASTVVRTLDELTLRGELLHGRFTAQPVSGESRKAHADAGGTGGLESQFTESHASEPEPRVVEPHTSASHAADSHPDQWLHRDVFRRIRSRSLKKARESVKPVDVSTFQTFLLDRQGVGPVGGERYEGVDGLMRVIEQLEGVALPASVWERSVFPARVRDYQPALLDELITSGDVVWIGSQSGAKPKERVKEPGLVSFHPANSPLPERFGHRDRRAAAGVGTLPDAIADVLSSSGAYRADQLAALSRGRWEEIAPEVDSDTGEIVGKAWSDSQFEEALWSLVWQGRVTNSSFSPVRALDAGTRAARAPSRASRRHMRMAPAIPLNMTGLWMAVDGADGSEADDRSDGAVIRATGMSPEAVRSFAASGNPNTGGSDASEVGPSVGRSDGRRLSSRPEQVAIARVEALLDRYGVVAQPLVDKENLPGGFSALYPVLRRMEEHGTLVRGMFVKGFGAAQFASKEVVDVLRQSTEGHVESAVALSVLDPANLAGSAVAWPDVSAGATKPIRRAGGVVVIAAGRPVAYAAVKSKHLTIFDGAAGRGGENRDGSENNEDGEKSESYENNELLRRALSELTYALRRDSPTGSITFADANGESFAGGNPYTRVLRLVGFTLTPQGMKLYR